MAQVVQVCVCVCVHRENLWLFITLKVQCLSPSENKWILAQSVWHRTGDDSVVSLDTSLTLYGQTPCLLEARIILMHQTRPDKNKRIFQVNCRIT